RELKARADDLETGARLLSRNLPTGVLSVAADETVVELNESGQEILKLSGNLHGRRYQEAFETIPEFRDSIGEVLSERKPVGRREIRWVSAGESRSFGGTEAALPGVVVRLHGPFPAVSGSEVLLRRALVNLLRNAVEATPPARRGEPEAIRLDGSSRDGEILMAVADRGEGVEASRRDEIFLPFYSTKPRGSGFGLAIVARIAELHGGTVEVGAHKDGGALFTLRLPE